MNYVDGFVVPVPKKNLAAYRRTTRGPHRPRKAGAVARKIRSARRTGRGHAGRTVTAG
jgi:uncharacterized protein YbaA (DUF1428 family)